MRKLLNTLYVTTPEAYLSKDGLNVVISVQQEEVFRIPVINIEGIVTFGYMGASPGVMKLCSDNGISLTFSFSTRQIHQQGSRCYERKCSVTQKAVPIVGRCILVVACGSVDDWW